jgi:GH35 family endo-1,4-beta-xylanase
MFEVPRQIQSAAAGSANVAVDFPADTGIDLRRILTVLVARPSVIATWGITDRYTWVPTWFKRTDGLINRPLPLDEFYRPKPLWSVIDYFCQKAV